MGGWRGLGRDRQTDRDRDRQIDRQRGRERERGRGAGAKRIILIHFISFLFSFVNFGLLGKGPTVLKCLEKIL